MCRCRSECVNGGDAGNQRAGGVDRYPGGATRSHVAERFDLIPMAGLRACALTMAKGAAVHGERNWMQGIPVNDCLNHAMKHLVQWMEGDRSEPHLAHSACNLLMAIHFTEKANDECGKRGAG